MSSLAIMAGDDSEWDSAALRRQDAAEFERLYHAFAPPLLRYLTRLCGDADLAQDLLQDTFVHAYRALPRTRPELHPRPWLYTIATNTARSALRLAHWKRVLAFSRRPPGAEEAATWPSAPPWENRYAEAELVTRALAALKADQAAALLLHWHEGFSLQELCAILGVSEATLKKRLYRAKQAFRVAYARECAAAEGREDR
jgi:RNA polymerase sigma-70 factor (ECF subfamily)